MSPRVFQLYMLWFRILRWIRKTVRSLTPLRGEIWQRSLAALCWLRAVALTPLWVSFEIYILAWDYLERRVSARYHQKLHAGHRALFCLVTSLVGCQALLVIVSGLYVSEVTVIVSAVHALVIFIFWKRGARWCRTILGARPLRPTSRNPYEGLDLNN